MVLLGSYLRGLLHLKTRGEHYESLQDSGSTYILHKSSERLSAITASIFASFEEQLKVNDGTIEVIDSSEFNQGT